MTLSRDRFASLVPPGPDPGEAPPGALVVRREVELVPVGDERLDVSARWRVVVGRTSSVAWTLAGPGLRVEQATIDGETVPVRLAEDGSTVLEALLTRSATVAVRGVVPSDPHVGVQLSLMPAGTGSVSVPPGWRAEGAVRTGEARALGASSTLGIAPAPQQTDRGLLLLAETAAGVTVGEQEIRVRLRLRWRVARGAVDRLEATLPGAGPDLDLRGPQIASWSREGDRIEIVLREPERALVAIEGSYTLPAPQGETARIPVPAIRAGGAFRTTSTLQLARDGQIDVVPELPAAEPRASSELPTWGRDLVEGTPTAAYAGSPEGGAITLLRFRPADSPPTLIDVASYNVATSADGRVLTRAHYAVRNDRGAVLRVRLPPGTTPIGVRVGGEAAKLGREGETWLVPLEKSVETVEGLLAFPVELILLGEDGAWSRRGARQLALPSVDAEIAASRLTLHLPPGFRGRRGGHRGDRVEAFTEGDGITYGFAVGDVRAAQADALFQQAVDAWMGNEFDKSGLILDQLDEMGASNNEMKKLRSNLAVLGDDDGDSNAPEGERMALERRVLEQARARSEADEREWEDTLKKADEAYSRGDYSEAEDAYRAALDLGEDLAKLSAKEDVNQQVKNAEVGRKLAQSSATGKQKAASAVAQAERAPAKAEPEPVQAVRPARPVELAEPDEPDTGVALGPAATPEPRLQAPSPAGQTARAPVEKPVSYPKTTTIDFEGIDIEGELVLPEGAHAIAPTPDAPPPLDVTAAALSVVIPAVGEAVRYQRLLLPAGATWVVPVEARTRRNP